MRRIVVSLVGALCAVCLIAPITVRSDDLPEYPYSETPLVSVGEIGPDGPNWVGITAHVVLGPLDLNTGAMNPSDKGFMPDNPDHMVQVHLLGAYTCSLFRRKAVVLSQVVENNPYKLWYLVACALP